MVDVNLPTDDNTTTKDTPILYILCPVTIISTGESVKIETILMEVIKNGNRLASCIVYLRKFYDVVSCILVSFITMHSYNLTVFDM